MNTPHIKSDSILLRLRKPVQVALLFCVLGLGVNEALGFGFLKKAFNAVKGALSFAGSIPGSFVGGFVGAATAPTISQAEQAGKSLIEQANQDMEKRLSQMDDIMKNRLGQMDSILKNRIDQVDAALRNRIGQVDTVLAVRIEQLDSILDRRLAELDELTEKRIGNLDIVATKASLTFEESIVRALAIGCLMVFFSFAVWLAYKEGVKVWPAIAAQPDKLSQKLVQFFKTLWPKVAGRLALAGAAVVLLWLGFVFLPGGAKGRTATLKQNHLQALQRHLASFDFREAAYQSSQLKTLDSTDSKLTGARLKTELLRDLFYRPSAIQSQDGFLAVTERIVEIEAHLGKDKDADVQTLKGIILWRSAGNKLFEHYAAACFASALDRSPKNGFALEPLAVSYLDIYLDSPLSKWVLDETPGLTADAVKAFAADARELFGAAATKISVEKMGKMLAKWRNSHGLGTNSEAIQLALQNGLTAPRPLRPYLAYNSLVKDLRRVSGTSYTEMLAAYAEGNAAKGKMTDAANAVLNAWNRFNDEVSSEAFDPSAAIRIAPLLLNDAIQGRAALYAGGGVSFDSVPAADKTDTSKVTRVKLQPRINNYLSGSPFAQKLVNWQETQRYCAYETETQAFESKFVSFRKAVSQGLPKTTRFERAFDAAASAAQLGLYDYRAGRPRPLAEVILQEAEIPETEMQKTYSQQFEVVRSALQRRAAGVL